MLLEPRGPHSEKAVAWSGGSTYTKFKSKLEQKIILIFHVPYSIQAHLEVIVETTKIKLAALWTSFMFLYIYVDYFHLYMPSALENMLAGKLFVFKVTQVALLAGLASVTIPALMISFSIVLRAKVNRWTNIIIAVIYIPFTLFNLVGVAWIHMMFGAVVEVILLCLIIYYAWKWTEQEA
jgi:Family of unknown function (DUF6326)